jgi:hypothetical protein
MLACIQLLKNGRETLNPKSEEITRNLGAEFKAKSHERT